MFLAERGANCQARPNWSTWVASGEAASHERSRGEKHGRQEHIGTLESLIDDLDG